MIYLAFWQGLKPPTSAFQLDEHYLRSRPVRKCVQASLQGDRLFAGVGIWTVQVNAGERRCSYIDFRCREVHGSASLVENGVTLH